MVNNIVYFGVSKGEFCDVSPMALSTLSVVPDNGPRDRPTINASD